jgi:hypothetical protein
MKQIYVGTHSAVHRERALEALKTQFEESQEHMGPHFGVI